MRRIAVSVLLFALVAGCGRVAESRLNPFNWFGSDRADAPLAPEVAVERDARPLVDQIVSVEVDRTAGGAILRAVGLPPRQGYWDAELVADPARSTPQSRVYQFRILPPPGPARVSTEASRQVVAAIFLSDQSLAGVREIQVLGARNARAVGR